MDTVLIPGEGLPSEENFDANTPTEEFEAKFAASVFAAHLKINTPPSEVEVKEIAKREGWRVLTCNCGEGLFQLIEVWVENRFMLEMMTPEQTARYIEAASPEFIAQAFGGMNRQKGALPENLSLIG